MAEQVVPAAQAVLDAFAVTECPVCGGELSNVVSSNYAEYNLDYLNRTPDSRTYSIVCPNGHSFRPSWDRNPAIAAR